MLPFSLGYFVFSKTHKIAQYGNPDNDDPRKVLQLKVEQNMYASFTGGYPCLKQYWKWYFDKSTCTFQHNNLEHYSKLIGF